MWLKKIALKTLLEGKELCLCGSHLPFKQCHQNIVKEIKKSAEILLKGGIFTFQKIRLKHSTMKKDFSFYEFVGIIVPSVILIFSCGFLYELTSGKTLVNLLSVGDAVVFTILAYGIGHIIQIFGGIYEALVWKILRGWPTGWLTKRTSLRIKTIG